MEILGQDLPDLFRNACFALFDNIVNLESVVPRGIRTLELSSETIEELFLDWLRELLFVFSTEYFVAKEVSSLELDGTRLRARLRGEKFDSSRHRVKIEIKTPTYHMFRITHDADGYRATIIFDV
jgi:SHS2 domain-containing protein